MVRLRTRLPSRQPSRRRMAGREFRLGTVSMYMATSIEHIPFQFNRKSHHIHGNINELIQSRIRNNINDLARF